MHVLLDAKEMSAQGTGLARYERELVARVVQLVPATVIVRERAVRDGSALLAGDRQVVVPDRAPASAVEQVVLPQIIRRLRPTTFHSLSGNLPLLSATSGRLVVTFHEDRSEYFRLYPPSGHYQTASVKLANLVNSRALRRAEVVLAISDTSGDVARRTARGQVVVVPHGVSELFRDAGERRSSSGSDPGASGHPYALVVASGDARDAVHIAVEAVASIEDGTHLVIAGDVSSARRASLEQVAAVAGVQVSFLGYVDDQALAGLYAGSRALLHVSRFEGFALTVVEALAAGCPVIALDSETLRSTFGSVVVFVKTSRDMGRALNLLSDTTVHAVQSRASREASLAFDWDQAAVSTCAVYR